MPHIYGHSALHVAVTIMSGGGNAAPQAGCYSVTCEESASRPALQQHNHFLKEFLHGAEHHSQPASMNSVVSGQWSKGFLKIQEHRAFVRNLHKKVERRPF